MYNSSIESCNNLGVSVVEIIKKQLVSYSKKSITLAELELLINPFVNSYQQFAENVLNLEKATILTMVKAKGRTSRTPSIAHQYRINKSVLVSSYHQQLQQYRLKLDPAINIDAYFSKDPAIWNKDLPYIEKIAHYIKQFSFPSQEVPAPERSFELVGDEKWIVEKAGKELLERLNLWSKLKIIPVSDPLMFAVNPAKINENRQLHLIVENKTTYQALSLATRNSPFATLIYGCGKKIIKSIEQFSNQYPVHAKHHFFYFGDIDKEGIAIWHSLSKKELVQLALPFYQACLKKAAVKGKEYQRDHQESLDCFLVNFSSLEREIIENVLLNGEYYPQEILKTDELQQIWRGDPWTSLNSTN